VTSHLKLTCKVPKDITVALSGGPDSIAALHFFVKGGRNVNAMFFHHGTVCSDKSYLVAKDFCRSLKVNLDIGRINPEIKQTANLEDIWRRERYAFLGNSVSPVITGHHLDDAVEWWVFTSLHGNGRLIPRIRGKYLRPFLLNKKSDVLKYCKRWKLPYHVDESNLKTDRPRVLIRNKMMYDCLKINPGLYKVIKKKYLKEIEYER
jgi:tRNA(Ile)-lysidine synthase